MCVCYSSIEEYFRGLCCYRDLSSESGTLFEVASEPSEDDTPQLQQENFFDDISLISSLSLMGAIDEDEDKCELTHSCKK